MSAAHEELIVVLEQERPLARVERRRHGRGFDRKTGRKKVSPARKERQGRRHAAKLTPTRSGARRRRGSSYRSVNGQGRKRKPNPRSKSQVSKFPSLAQVRGNLTTFSLLSSLRPVLRVSLFARIALGVISQALRRSTFWRRADFFFILPRFQQWLPTSSSVAFPDGLCASR